CLFSPSTGFSQPASEKDGIIPFRKKVENYLKHPCLKKGNFGIQIFSLDKGESLYQYQSNHLFIPASNLKLITTAAAMTYLGPNYRFTTELHTDGEVKEDVLHGNLYFKGFGDPKLVTEHMWILANQLKNQPIKKVGGNLIADDSFFDNVRRVKSWKKKFGAEAYNAPLGALSFNFNTVTVFVLPGPSAGSKPVVVVDPNTDYTRVSNQAVTLPANSRNRLIVNRVDHGEFNEIVLTGGIPHNGARSRYFLNITNPAYYAARVFKLFLAQAGVEVTGEIQNGILPDNAKLLLQHESEPLSLILRGLNKFSNNFVAEQVVKAIAAKKFGAPGNTKNGVKVINEYMQSLGFAADGFTLVDGSGLSRNSRLSPNHIVAVLRDVDGDMSIFPEFISSLAVMGQDGSVKERMNGRSGTQRLRVKTGTLNGVSSISGYFQADNRERFAFSILMNDLKCGNNAAISIQDKILMEGLKFNRGAKPLNETGKVITLPFNATN
ncbi:MAG: D-alanyl-D-alanine carboxypeptidase/D-alanyl-D-alanine-endopeptidase, partial [Nitrospinota bacterium]|nr:D-alanyl-D-alanine carboxypeptidase/D-alanyl-D-alanine-endopeptidase [Nitrospinota bacterium]